MFEYGRLAILGFNLQPLDYEEIEFINSSELIDSFEAYREKLDRSAKAIITPERAQWLVYHTTVGPEEEKLSAAAKAALDVTPLPDNQG